MAGRVSLQPHGAPSSVSAWDNLGTVLLRRGDRAGAAEAFQHAIAIDPNDSRARAHVDALRAPSPPAPRVP